MLSYTLVFGLLAATATAVAHLPLLPRQTDTSVLGDSGDCIGALLEVAADAPLPPPEIQDIITDYYMTATGVMTDACAWQTLVPGSLADDWSSYQSDVLQWYSDNKNDLASALEKCPADYSSSAGPCTGTIALATDAKATGASGGDAGDGSSSGSNNGGGGQSNDAAGKVGLAAVGALVIGVVGGVFAVL